MPQPLHTANSLASNFQQVNSLITDVKNDKSVRVIKDDTGTPVVILSKNGLQTTSPGAGIDVTTATDDQYTFNSEQNVFKIALSNTATVSTQSGGGQTQKTITHNLNYIPAILAFVNASGVSYQPLPYGPPSGGTGSATITFNLYIYILNITSTTFDIFVTNGNALGLQTYNIKYYLLQETAN